MIGVGVNAPVYVEKAEKNEKGTLTVTFKEASDAKPKSLLEQMNEGADDSGNSGGSVGLMLFPPSTEYTKDGEKKIVEGPRRVQLLMDFKNQLAHILLRYVPSKEIRFNVVKGLVLKTDEELFVQVMDEKKYLQIYGNIVEQFIEQATKFKIFDSTKTSRLLLVRQSAEKHFGRLRDKFLTDQPFLEDIIVPKDKSKLLVKAGSKGATTLFEPDADGYVPKFTDYEIGKGLDNPIRSASAADQKEATPEEHEAVEGIFGGGKSAEEEPIDFGRQVEDETLPAPAAEEE
jgi:F0F1-type ATP synthase delta subunit